MIRTSITANLLLACALHQGRGFAATVTTTADAGPGSLRAAIAAAGPGETITFSITGAVTLTSGELQISKNVRIAGPGASLMAIERHPDAPSFRIFSVMSSANASSISGVTIRNGAGNENQDSGAGIQNYGRLAVTDCVFDNNVAADRGGGIYNGFDAALLVSNCVFRANGSTGEYGEGGGIYVFGEVTVVNSSFLGNGVHDRGGGLQVDMFGRAIVSGCTFSGNWAVGREGQGGGIYNYGTLAMTNCTLTGNMANESGAALHNDALAPALRISSCTVFSNTSPEGAIYLNGLQLPQQVNRLHNSIVCGNGLDVVSRSPFVSDGFNIIGRSAGDRPLVLRPTDRTNVAVADLHLGPLRMNGGMTMTHALLPGSVAFETGDDSKHPGTDQRGVARPHYVHCDVGAYEVNNLSPAIACTFTNVECTATSGTFSVSVSDADGDALTVIWGSLGSEFQTNYLAAGTTFAPVLLTASRPVGPGMNFVPVLVFDGITESMNCLATVNVQDTEPPAIDAVGATPNVLWPPNHKMVPVTLSVSARDACGGRVTSRIRSITSNGSDPQGGGLDWVITGALSANLRAELPPGSKSRRVYTITVESVDDAGNAATKTVDVAVSRD